jgi:nicotinamidase/pyrazinamidase
MILLNPADTCILVVDPQPTFMPGGELPVADGDAIVVPGRAFLERLHAVPAVVTQDWHPPGHISFASRHPGRQPFDTIPLYGHDQTLWPDHAVQGTATAAVHPGLPLHRFDLVLRKGTRPDTDSYSAFRENYGPDGRRPPTGLAGYLRERGVRQLLVWGLALDYCVAWSALDARQSGFEVILVTDLTRPVWPARRDGTLQTAAAAGIRLCESGELTA